MFFYIKLPKMKVIYNVESVLITITVVLCSILLFNLLYKLRSALPWRVNCWFCNNYFWVKFLDRNSWMCQNCEQYNGFTKDGDYNRVIISTSDQSKNTPKVFQRSPPKNGLCKMCNINQQLKVTQLANFVPMNEKSFDREIEFYRIQLEKAYKLCSPCRKVVQMKLLKEKETLLGSKLLESRTPEKKNVKKQNKLLHTCINKSSEIIACILLILVSYECYKHVIKNKSFLNTIVNMKEIVAGLMDVMVSILKMKTFMTFPFLKDYSYDIEKLFNIYNFESKRLENVNEFTQQVLGGFVCLIQIIGHIWNINKLKYTVIIDLLWSVFVITSLAKKSVSISPIVFSFIKILSALTVLMVYRNMKRNTSKFLIRKVNITPNKVKNIFNGCTRSFSDIDNLTYMDTDDDVSLNKYGLQNFSGSSNGSCSPVNNNIVSGRSYTPRNYDSIWTKPKLNTTFCMNSLITNPAVNDGVFVKPSFKKYQKLATDDSNLDEVISSLCISSPKKVHQKNNPIFSLRKFNPTPNFIAPTPMNRSRPLISPSKFGASWVAGGYWGSEGERTIFNLTGSRSSSQSSGFESQASSMTQRNVFSQPPSREESVCREPDKASVLSDRFQNCNMSNSFHPPQNFRSITSPVFPQMHYNSHVYIPQPRYPQHTNSNAFGQPQFNQNSIFKTPGSSGIIKLPQVNNSFTSH